eukprot:gene2470-17165_t
MKSDIEGQDMMAQSHMMTHGVWCHMSVIYGEHMEPDWIQAMQTVANHSKNCPTQLLQVDDEDHLDCLPLPGHEYSDPDERKTPDKVCVTCIKEKCPNAPPNGYRAFEANEKYVTTTGL